MPSTRSIFMTIKTYVRTLTISALSLSFVGFPLTAQSQSDRNLKEQFKYRSIAFQGQMDRESYIEGDVVHPGVLKEVAALGFNDICFHVERGPQTKQITSMHQGLTESGLIDLIEELGMTTSVWVHEFMQLEESWGEPTADNEVLWNALRERYEGYLELWPEIDYFVVTCTETDMSPKGKEVFQKIYETIGGVIRDHGGNMIVRSFYHGRFEVWVEEMSPVIPDYAYVQHKYVKGDWQLRLPNNPLITMPEDHPMLVEFDIAGEYYEGDSILNCFADELAQRMEEYIIPADVDGISVRVNRRGATAYDHPNAINYWYLGLLTSDQVSDVDEAWKRYTTEMFGEELADEMTEILRVTGEVSAEAFSYGKAAYGNNRLKKVADFFGGVDRGERFDRALFIPPHSSFDRDSEEYEKYRADYESQLRGDMKWIEQDAAGYKKQLAAINNSIEKLEGLKHRLDDATYTYMHWLLEETRWNLVSLQEFQQAHFKAFRALHIDDEQEKQQLLEEIQQHLQVLAKQSQIAEQTERTRMTWRDRQENPGRGAYMDLGTSLMEFRIWLNYFGLGDPLKIDKDDDGKKEEVVDTFDELEEYMVEQGWRNEAGAEETVGYSRAKHDSYQDWVDYLFYESRFLDQHADAGN